MSYEVFESLFTIVIKNKTVDKVSSSYVKKREELGTQMNPRSIALDLLFEKVLSLKKALKLNRQFLGANHYASRSHAA